MAGGLQLTGGGNVPVEYIIKSYLGKKIPALDKAGTHNIALFDRAAPLVKSSSAQRYVATRRIEGRRSIPTVS
jgi:hypothetical protein